MLTNHKDALPLVSGDRRYCVMFSRVQNEDQLFRELGGKDGARLYFDQLFDDVQSRPDAIAHYFKNRSVSAQFNPRGRAPETNAKNRMIDVAVSPDRNTVEDCIRTFDCIVINDRMVDVTYLNRLCEQEHFDLPKPRTLGAILLEIGYDQVEGRRVWVAKTNQHHYLWFRPDLITSDDVIATAKGFYDDPLYAPF
jgi:hypothetical protein